MSEPEATAAILASIGLLVVLVVPEGSTVLIDADHVCVFVPPSERGLLDLLFGGEADALG